MNLIGILLSLPPDWWAQAINWVRETYRGFGGDLLAAMRGWR